MPWLNIIYLRHAAVKGPPAGHAGQRPLNTSSITEKLLARASAAMQGAVACDWPRPYLAQRATFPSVIGQSYQYTSGWV